MDIFIRIRKSFTNVHKHRNPKNTKHLRLSFFASGTKLLFPFFSLRFFDMWRERHSFLLCWLFHLTPPRAAPHRKLLLWPRRAPENQLPSSSVESQLTVCLFFSNSEILSPSLRAWRHSRPWYHFLFGFFYCDICGCHILPSRVCTSALNVCT